MPIIPTPLGANTSSSSSNPNTSASAGDKRTRPQEEEAQTSSKKPRLEKAYEWARVFSPIRSLVDARMISFFENTAQHVLTLSDQSIAQDLFNELMVSGQWALLVDVFEGYQQAVQAMPAKEQRLDAPPPAPFSRTLVLQLPADWVPVNQAEMTGALESLGVESLEVLRPKTRDKYELVFSSTGEFQYPEDPDAILDEQEMPISVAACACVAALLKGGGVTELGVDGTLADPDMVANALGNSGLRSASFKASSPGHPNEPQDPLSDAEARCYRTLALSLETCSSLEHLTLAHPDLLELRGSIVRFAAPGGPQLTSLSIRFYHPHIQLAAGGEAPSTEIQPFMAAVGGLKTLTTFRAEVDVTDRDALKAIFIDPLRDHPSLTHASFGLRDGYHIAAVTESNLTSMLELLRFALRCELTDLTWTIRRCDQKLGDLLEDYRRKGGLMEFAATLQEIRDILTDPRLVLRNFCMEGVHALSKMLEAFHDGLRINRSLRNLVIDQCPQSLESTEKAKQAFEQNPLLESMKLGFCFDDYYITLEDGSIHSVEYDHPDGGSFNGLKLRGDLDPDTIAAANQTFAMWQPHANTLFASLKSIAMQRRVERVLRSVVANMGTTTTLSTTGAATTTTTTTTMTSITTGITTTRTTGMLGESSSATSLTRTTQDMEQPQ
ncbi:hypothetical protein [Hydrogenophaga sp.]|uniref:hypothetical protein n=1 Tax=Hydrogenophaga sp. TaxID=1904254 RepID=UPI0027290E2E|nr:hypothetical protein [Hydrogenophaga sp.]MDO9436846.1 hypothetical protein [Hydrogenophaga sp.]